MNGSTTQTASTTNKASVAIPFAAIVVAMLPAVLDQTILSTALPTIAVDLGRVSDVSWLVTAYVVAAAATTPLWGKLGDRHGRKRLLQIALTGFVATSSLCGAAQDMTALIILRAIQGATAGGLMALAMAAVGDLVAPRERGRYQGYIAAAFAAATIAGPLIGGLLVEHVGWRWVFYVNLPVGALALLGLSRTLPTPKLGRPEHALDVAGAVLLAAATSALMLVCIWGGERFAWLSAQTAGLVVATVLLGAALVWRERRVADPLVPFDMLRTRSVAVASGALFLGTAALFSVTVFVPLFLQVTTGASPIASGLLLVPMMIGTTVSTTLSGRSIARTGRYKRFPLLGLALMTAGLVLLAILSADPSRVRTAIAVGVFGLGFGMVTQVLIIAVQNTVDRPRLGIATAATTFFRGLGGAAGAAVLGAVFAAQTGGAHASNVQALAHASHAAISTAVQTVFAVAAPVALLALLVTLLLPEVPLAVSSDSARTSARQSADGRSDQRRGEEASAAAA
jgi:EmrB/QacA subfamily drug resistance transporter